MYIINNINLLDILFITTIMITISNVLLKLDPNLSNFINKNTYEKRIYNIKLNIITFIIIYLLLILIWVFQLFTIQTNFNDILYIWLLLFNLIFFIIIYFYYKNLHNTLKWFNYNSLSQFPTLNINKILPNELLISISFINILVYNLITTDNIIFFYFLFELVNLFLYTIIGINQNSPKGAEAAIKYYFISFLSSLFCLWGSAYIYGFSGLSNFTLLVSYLINYNNLIQHYGILTGFLFILLSFFIKLGMFPTYLWIPNVYEKTSNFIFLYLMTISKFSFYIIFLKYIFLLLKTQFYNYLFQDIFKISAMGSVIAGSLYLLTRGTVKGFLATNSIVSWGILNLNIASLYNSYSFVKFINILQWNVQYIIIYINLIFIIYILWLNWYVFVYWNKLYLYYFFKLNWIKSIIISIQPKDINIKYVFQKNYNVDRLSNIFYLFLKYNDIISIIFIWIVGGFPPFILFLTKFYIASYAWENLLLFSTFIVWFVINTFGIYSYMKGLSLFLARFSKV